MTVEDFDSETKIGELVPDGFTVLDYTLQAKCLDPDGDVSLVSVKSSGFSNWEARGALDSHLQDLRDQARECYHDHEEGDVDE